MDEALIVLEREINGLANYERQLERQLEKFPADSKDARGARQAQEVVRQRRVALKAAIRVLGGGSR